MKAPRNFEHSIQTGILSFNLGHYWDAHEAWESPWRTAKGPDKALLQAYIMAAGALFLLDKRRPDPARRLAKRYFEKMNDGEGAALAHSMRCGELEGIMKQIIELPENTIALDYESILSAAQRLKITRE
jgi:predicted metal-dependent hydrolase